MASVIQAAAQEDKPAAGYKSLRLGSTRFRNPVESAILENRV